MQEVVCYNCGRIVHISPDAELCSVCGENLRELLHPVYASKYFYDRAAQLAAGDQLLPALQEIDRGLRYQPSSELRLLGAILAKRMGDFEQMRYHVAAIPVDDVLRPEGEWLLRSHQMRQRELREASKGPTNSRANASLSLEDELSYAIRQGQPALTTSLPRTNTSRRLSYVGAFAVLVMVVLAGGALIARNTQLFSSLLRTDGETASSSDRSSVGAPADGLAEPVRQPAQGEMTEGAAPTLAATPVITPTATTAPDVPANVVELVTTPTTTAEEVAVSTPGLAVGINAAQPFDLQSYLEQLNRRDLAQLEVSASLQGTILSLQGFVPSFAARQALLELAKSVPGVTTVSDVDLLLRLPPTYLVQPGDTLWDITYQLYGDVSKIPLLLDANRDILPAPEALNVGMELKIPPIE